MEPIGPKQLPVAISTNTTMAQFAEFAARQIADNGLECFKFSMEKHNKDAVLIMEFEARIKTVIRKS